MAGVAHIPKYVETAIERRNMEGRVVEEKHPFEALKLKYAPDRGRNSICRVCAHHQWYRLHKI